MPDFNKRVIEEFRGNRGVVGGPFAGAPMLLLTTTGRRSGERRTNPLVCQTGKDGTVYVFASKGGAPADPDWYTNLVADPKVHVELGSESFDATAEPVTGDLRDEIYARQAERFPAFAEYQRKADRLIPVVALLRE